MVAAAAHWRADMVGKIVLAAMMIATAAMQMGCNHSTYVVVEDLPNPPTPLATAPSDAQPSEPAPAEPTEAPPAGWIPAATDHAWRYIVIHHSATDTGSADDFDRMHRHERGWDELGYHFVITNGRGGPDGAVQIGPRWHKQKWGAHCGGTPDNQYNNVGIGICLVGQFDDHTPSEQQIESLIRLVRFLVGRYRIRPANILGHADAPNARTACPGAQLHAYIRGRFPKELGL